MAIWNEVTRKEPSDFPDYKSRLNKSCLRLGETIGFGEHLGNRLSGDENEAVR